MENNSSQKSRPFLVNILIDGVIWISLGIILLLNTTGNLPWSVWETLIKFWPVLIILLGLRILAGRNLLANLIVAIIALGLITGVVLFSIANVGSQPTSSFWQDLVKSLKLQDVNQTTHEQIVKHEDYPEVAKRQLDIEIDSESFKVNELIESNDYLNLRSTTSGTSSQPVLKHELVKNTLFLDFRTEHNSILPFGLVNQPATYEFLLGKKDLKTDLTVDLSSGSGEINIDKINYGRIVCDIASGSLALNLKDEGNLPDNIKIDLASGNTQIRLPKNINIKVEYEIASGNINFNGEALAKDQTMYTNPTTEVFDNTLTLTFKVASGNVTIEQ